MIEPIQANHATLPAETLPVPPAETAPLRAARRRLSFWDDVVPFVVVVVAAIVARQALFSYQSGDMRDYLQPWWKEIVTHGHLAALKRDFSNYAPSYLYLLALVSYLPVGAAVGVKFITFAFEAIMTAAFVNIAMTTAAGRTRYGRLLALALPLFAPSVLLNGAFWGQCDAIHTAFILLALRAALKDRWISAAVLTGVALSFKLQAIFFFPGLIMMMTNARLRRRQRWLIPLLVPLVYFLSLVPAWIAGRPIRDLLMIYVHQTDTYASLSLAAPTVYSFLPGAPYREFHTVGIAVTVLVLGAGLLLVRQSSRPWGRRERLLTAIGSTMVCAFFLPAMHERYFFTADILTMLLPFWLPRRWWVPLAVVSASTMAYGNYLFGQLAFELKYLTLAMLVALAFVLRDWAQGLDLRWGRHAPELEP